MTAINFDLDKKVAKVQTKTVRIGGKDHQLAFDDHTRQLLDDLRISALGVAQSFDDISDAFANDYTVAERKKTLSKAVSDQRDALMSGLDDLLGKDEGKRIYDFYGHSFVKLAEVVRELSKLQDQEDGIKEENAEHKHNAKRARYTGKHKRG